MAEKTTLWSPAIGDIALPITPTSVGTGQEAASFESLEVGGAPVPGVANSGTVTLNGATPVDVADTGVTANSIIIFTIQTPAGTQGAYPVATPTPGTGFAVKGTALDTGVYNWIRIG